MEASARAAEAAAERALRRGWVLIAMYTVCGLLNTPMDEYTREALPPIFAVVALIFTMAFYLPIVVFLPDLVMGTSP